MTTRPEGRRQTSTRRQKSSASRRGRPRRRLKIVCPAADLAAVVVCVRAGREQSSISVDQSFKQRRMAVLLGTSRPAARRACAHECRPGADQGDEMWCVDRPPALLCRLDQLGGHRQPGGAQAGTLGDLGPMPDGGEGGHDGPDTEGHKGHCGWASGMRRVSMTPITSRTPSSWMAPTRHSSSS